MNITLKNNLVDAICSDWKDWKDNKVKFICLELLDYVIKTNPKQLVYLSYASLYKIAKLESNNELDNSNLLQAIQYLVGDKVSILCPCFELIDGNNVFSLTNKDASLALDTGKLIHPITGEEINDMSKLVVYFTVTDLVKDMNIYI